MAKYRYTATDRRGKWVSGEVVGQDPTEAEARMLAEGLTIESLVEAESSGLPSKNRLRHDDAVELVRQLAGLARSGLPLPSGLRASGLEVESEGLRSIFSELARAIESGENLEAAVSARGDRFPGHFQGLILAASRSGRLADLLAESVEIANIGSDLRRRFWGVVAYPMITAVLVMVLVVFVCGLSVRTAQQLRASLNEFTINIDATMSGSSLALLVMARAISDHWHEIAIGSLVMVVGTWVFLRYTIAPARLRRWICQVPVLGPAIRLIALTEFCRLLALLLEAETPMPRALELAGQGIGDAEVAESCDQMADAVARGEPLSKAMRIWPTMPAGLGQLFHWSEGQQALPEALRLAGEMFEARARSQVGFVANFLNTLLVLLILWWVGFALATLYLPLTSLIQVISKLSG